MTNEQKASKTFQQKLGRFDFKLEGLPEGYRFSVKGDPDRIKQQRKVGASFINFVRQADNAGWYIPLPFRLLLGFWKKYK